MDAGFRPSREHVDRAQLLNRLAAPIVAPAFFAMGLLYLGFALAAPWLGRPPEAAAEHRLLHWAAFATLFACLVAQLRLGVEERSAHPWQFALAALVSLVNARELATLHDPSHGTYLMLTAFAASYGFLSIPWFVAALLCLATAWGVPAAAEWSSSDAWRDWTFRFSTALLVSAAVFATRRRSVLNQELLRLQAEDRGRAAAAALEEATTADRERLAMQQAMQAAQRRESLGMLAGGIAHDFNNLLTVISGNLEVARDELGEDSPLQEHLADANSAAEHAARLTRQMLVYAGRARPNVVRVDLGMRVRQVVRMVGSSLPAGVRLRERGTGDGPVVEADGAQLDQVLINLVQNAVDACRDAGGHVDVDWGVEEVDAEALEAMHFADSCLPGSYAFAEVRDDGPGMPPEVRQRMFEPFFTTKASGSGLGLAAVEGIAEGHRGALSVETAPGSGTRIRFLLPRGEAREKRLAPAAASSPAPRASVLVVDDERGVRRVARLFLERQGYRVLSASNGLEALAAAREAGGLHAALIDLTLVDENGYEIAEELRTAQPSLPIVIMSGFDRDEVMANRADAASYDFLAKPFSQVELVDALRVATETGSEPDA